MSKNKKKKKKQKVTYIDDGRSLADMSGLGGGRSNGSLKGSYSDQMKTFFSAMKMMVKPMLVTMGIITVAFFFVWLLLTLAN